MEETGEIALNWGLMKKYSVAIWYDNNEELKSLVEKIAQNNFHNSKDKDPAAAALWYIIIGKKNVLARLY